MRKHNSSIYILSFCLLFLGTTTGCGQSEQKNQKSGSESQLQLSQQENTDKKLKKRWELSKDVKRPESAVYAPEGDVLFISNMAGGATEKNGKGYISKISTDGTMLEDRWAKGLNAPKGLAIHGKYLYASDIDRLVKIDLETGKIVNSYQAKNAKFLNDVTADTAGNVYVSDSGDNTVYRLQNGTFDIWLKSDKIKSPNGLYAKEGRLIIAACGIQSDNPGSNRYLQAISYDTKQITPIGKEKPIGGLDAVQPDGMGGYFLTDWGAAKVMHYTPENGAKVLKKISRGTADLDYIADQKLLVLPIMMSNKVMAFEVK